MRAIGLDLGTKSLGVAISDSNKIIASGIKNFRYTNNSLDFCIKKIQEIVKQYKDVDTIVLGYAKYKSGDKSTQTYLAEQFMDLLKQNFKHLNLVFHDESYSTTNVIRQMKEVGLKYSQIKKNKDKMAAVYILQDWINSNHASK